MHDEQIPDDLRKVAARLSKAKDEIDALEIDRLKQRALAQSTGRNRHRGLMRSRLATLIAALALVAGSGGALALSHLDSHPNSHGGAADDQYRPGKGCGDKNHRHKR